MLLYSIFILIPEVVWPVRTTTQTPLYFLMQGKLETLIISEDETKQQPIYTV